MKIYLFVILLFSVAMSCKNKNNVIGDITSHRNIDQTTAAKSEKAALQPLDSLKNDVGKKLKANDLFKKYGIQSRLKKMLGKDFKNFEEGWGEESPLKKELELLYATSCKKDNCSSLKILLIIDILTNNLNVYIFQYGTIKTYEEYTIIGLTDSLGTIFEKMRDAQSSH
ncbi:MAG: hypothetical protein IPL55_08495 [Saprospiraceae bacterium]|jgi:hypothetical protein|nr:hypothetical protein [Saprospiraceae bacterium]MBL0027270.1 hypothetical protein [Saprospiraceae bacterium]